MSATALALLTLLHLLVPIYWLGGDLGAFYSARFLVDPNRSVAERLMALTILNTIDMAPRTTLILAFPTGFSLAVAKGWVDSPPAVLGLVWAGFLAWLALAWAVHLHHGPASAGLRRLDIAVRYGVLAALTGAGVAGLAGAIALPLFLSLKLLVLAGCVTIGLLVRRQLVPLFPAIVALRRDGATPAGDAVIRGVIAVTQPTVITLWVLVLIACLLGLATPV
ncbi:hypothetical protein ACFOON_00305 [Novosphingobium piscinae]|uniref:Uncharacterized protein n=1 Tax=Novosphingobium piscinae TaxID=1507448 RepID=A0A7X1KQQ9_9SPHN|nr:hypothetical protein [Novosphingobium piscinae]MBC2669840.1 hypothetical protein [Novosphingobium piscinae]